MSNPQATMIFWYDVMLIQLSLEIRTVTSCDHWKI